MSDKELERKILNTMNAIVRDGIVYPDMCGDLCMTELAEVCAHDMGHDEWLDDETHIVWECAYHVADDYTEDEVG